MARVEMDVANVDDLEFRKSAASHAMDSIEAKHVAGGGTTDISQEVDIVRSYHDAVDSVVQAAVSARNTDAKAAEQKAETPK